MLDSRTVHRSYGFIPVQSWDGVVNVAESHFKYALEQRTKSRVDLVAGAQIQRWCEGGWRWTPSLAVGISMSMWLQIRPLILWSSTLDPTSDSDWWRAIFGAFSRCSMLLVELRSFWVQWAGRRSNLQEYVLNIIAGTLRGPAKAGW